MSYKHAKSKRKNSKDRYFIYEKSDSSSSIKPLIMA